VAFQLFFSDQATLEKERYKKSGNKGVLKKLLGLLMSSLTILLKAPGNLKL